MILTVFFIFTFLVKGIFCGRCFHCDSMNYASCKTVTCPSTMCQTRTAMNGMVSHMCWSGSQTVSPGCTVKFGEKVCVCSGDRCNDAGIASNNNSNASGGNNANTGNAGWGNWGNNNGMNGNNGNIAGWGNGMNGQNGDNGGNWKDWGHNQAQNWGKANGHSAGNNGNCNGSGNSTECDGNGNFGLATEYNFLLTLTMYLTARALNKY